MMFFLLKSISNLCALISSRFSDLAARHFAWKLSWFFFFCCLLLPFFSVSIISVCNVGHRSRVKNAWKSIYKAIIINLLSWSCIEIASLFFWCFLDEFFFSSTLFFYFWIFNSIKTKIADVLCAMKNCEFRCELFRLILPTNLFTKY
jgi:hypothetical protein